MPTGRMADGHRVVLLDTFSSIRPDCDRILPLVVVPCHVPESNRISGLCGGPCARADRDLFVVLDDPIDPCSAVVREQLTRTFGSRDGRVRQIVQGLGTIVSPCGSRRPLWSLGSLGSLQPGLA
eukprot:1174011-Pleurochrysis_carterae.AAC.2